MTRYNLKKATAFLAFIFFASNNVLETSLCSCNYFTLNDQTMYRCECKNTLAQQKKLCNYLEAAGQIALIKSKAINKFAHKTAKLGGRSSWIMFVTFTLRTLTARRRMVWSIKFLLHQILMGDKMGLAARLSLWLHARLSARQAWANNATWNKNFHAAAALKTNFFKNSVKSPSPTDSGSAVINPDSTFNWFSATAKALGIFLGTIDSGEFVCWPGEKLSRLNYAMKKSTGEDIWLISPSR